MNITMLLSSIGINSLPLFSNSSSQVSWKFVGEVAEEKLTLFKARLGSFWIFFWYIKWQKEFISDRYIIIQNLEYETNSPSILDIKIGNEKKISKETGQVKKFKGAFESLGCRIMGISSNNLYFKSRYDTKDLNENFFINELKLFFDKNNNIIEAVIKELQDIIIFLQNSFFKKNIKRNRPS